MLQGRDVGESRMNVRPAQGAGGDDAEEMDCRCRETHRRGIACTKLISGLTLIRESPIAPAQHILFFIFAQTNDT